MNYNDENNKFEEKLPEEKLISIETEKSNQEISQKKAQAFYFNQSKDDSINKAIWGTYEIRSLESKDFLDNEQIYRTPITNIIEGESEYYLLLELPGLSKNNVELILQAGLLEVKGRPSIEIKEKKEEKKSKDKKEEKKDKEKKEEKHKEKKEKEKKKDKLITGNYLRREFREPSFYRSFILPEDINVEDIVAKFKNGVLKLTIPKKSANLSGKHVIEIK